MDTILDVKAEVKVERRRWIDAVGWGALLAFGLDKLVDVVLERVPFSPLYQFRDKYPDVFEHLLVGQQPAALPLLQHLVVFNVVKEYAIALLVGVLIGWWVARHPGLAGLLAMPPVWGLNQVSNLFAVDIIERFSSLASPAGEHGLNLPYAVWSIVVATPMLLTAAVAAALVNWLRKRRQRNEEMG